MWRRSFSSPASTSASTRGTCHQRLTEVPSSRTMAERARWRLRCARLNRLATSAVPALVCGIESAHVGDTIRTGRSKAPLAAISEREAVEHTRVAVTVFNRDGLDQITGFA